MKMPSLTVLDIGRASYAPTLDLQVKLVERVKQFTEESAYLVLVEHDPPVITIGRSGSEKHVLASREELAGAGIEIFESNRGGDVTYHGPGQIVGYPIIRVDLHGKDIHNYLRNIEETIIRLLKRFNIAGRRVKGLTGVWVGDEKIAATGVTISRWVSYHGFALNVSTDLSHFRTIVPCGITDKNVTSMSALLGREISVEEVKSSLVECFAEVFGFDLMREDPVSNARKKFPSWLKKRLKAGGDASAVSDMLADMGLTTVCSGAHCPNLPECYGRRTVTFMILGRRCTRDCRFCAVPAGPAGPPDPDEPAKVAEACVLLGLRHVVITSVTRDDLPDGGAGHFAATIRAVRQRIPDAVIEVLTPDFRGDRTSLDTILAARPDVFNHNVETIARLYSLVRSQADYNRSLEVLKYVSDRAERDGMEIYTKSGMMVGLGETGDEVVRVMRDLRDAGCSMLTIGQYLAPTTRHLPVVCYVEPHEYDIWKACAGAMGFTAVAAGPFVRSSYDAERVFKERVA